MTLSIIGIALALLTAVIKLVTWYIQRKKDPTPIEQKQDVQRASNDTFQNVYRLRQEGKHFEADEMLRRMSGAAVYELPNDGISPFHTADATRQRLGDHSTQGDTNPPQ